MPKERRRCNTTKKYTDQKSSDFGNLDLPNGVKLFKPKEEGPVRFDIVPYEVTEDHNPVANAGDIHFERTYYAHSYIGGNSNESVVCPRRTFGKPCPICAHQNKMAEQGVDPDIVSKLNPKRRQIFNIVDLKDDELKVMDLSFSLFGEQLQDFLKDLREDEEEDNVPEEERDSENWCDTVDGKTLKVYFKKTTMGKGKPFLKASTVNLKKRSTMYDDEIIDEAQNLDNIFKVRSNEYLTNMLAGIETDDDYDDEEEDDGEALPERETRKPVRRTKKKQPETEPEEEQEEEEEPVKETRRKTTRRKTTRKQPEEPEPEEDEPEEPEEEVQTPRKTTRKSNRRKTNTPVEEPEEPEEEEEEEEPPPPPRRKNTRRKSTKQPDPEPEEDEPEEDEEEEEPPPPPRRKSTRRRTTKQPDPEPEPEEDEPEEDEPEEEEEPPPRRKSTRTSKTPKATKGNKCPLGKTFGEDFSQLVECDDCDLFTECNEAFDLTQID